jgi:hypothetical protein
MTEQFELSVQYKGEEKIFAVYFIPKGYSYQLKIVIDQKEIFFEPDEGGSFRVIVANDLQQKDFEKTDQQLLYEIQQQLEKDLK